MVGVTATVTAAWTAAMSAGKREASAVVPMAALQRVATLEVVLLDAATLKVVMMVVVATEAVATAGVATVAVARVTAREAAGAAAKVDQTERPAGRVAAASMVVVSRVEAARAEEATGVEVREAVWVVVALVAVIEEEALVAGRVVDKAAERVAAMGVARVAAGTVVVAKAAAARMRMRGRTAS